MNPDVRQLFHELIERSPRERELIFRERSIETAIRAEVESLLGFDSDQAESLTRRVSDAADDVLRSAEGFEKIHCGPYRLVRLLGSGGMGTVYLAERTDGEIQQSVAVKLLRADGHSKIWRERFLKERQLLASLSHPSIVHVIDAGHTEDGRPYLVMEHVDGVPIDEYAAKLDVRRRLQLFLRVCEGVSYAHRRLIIHRDLKPSNILVDSSGRPKLLDFGIARLLDETGAATQTMERILTPNYASPEQLAGTAQTTATDIYSLGAVLYKLLVGRTPRESVTATPKAEITTPSAVNPGVPNDVDFIVKKALRAEPEERYLSVDEFASDIRAALDWRPVKARSGDMGYRARRFLRRYWIPITAAMLVIASLSVGLYIANQERALAERRFVEVRQLANKLFDIDVQVSQLPGSTKVRQLIVDTSLEYLQRVTTNITIDPELALELGTAYMRVARVQGVNISPNLGQTKQADQTALKAQALISSVLVVQPRNRIALLRSSQIAHDRMTLAGDGNFSEEALKLARESDRWLVEYLNTGKLDKNSDRMEAQQAIIIAINVANRYRSAQQFDDALRMCEQAIDTAQATSWPTQAGAAMINLALTRREMGDLDDALKAIRDSVRLLDPGTGEKGSGQMLTYASALVREAQILGEEDEISLGRPQEAVELLQRAFQIADDGARRDADDFRSNFSAFSSGTKMAAILGHTDPRRALGLYDEGLQRLERARDNAGYRRNKATALAASVELLDRLGRREEARKRLDNVFELARQLKLYPADSIQLGSVADISLRALAAHEASGGNTRHAAELYQELLRKVLATNPKPETNLVDAVHVSNLYRTSAPVHRQAGRTEEALSLQTRRGKLWKGWAERYPNNPFVRRQLAAARL